MLTWDQKANALISSVPAKDQVPLRDMYEERAAIIEYDGGLPRDLAERAAYEELIEEHKRLSR